MSSPIVSLFGGPAVGDARQPTVAEAVAGGAAADRLGHAFLAGYAAALRALVPSLPVGDRVALCATEEGGAHPRAIQCRLEEGRLFGKKTFVTGGSLAERLLVVAREAGGALRAVSVDAHGPGVAMTAQPPTPFAPEVSHAAVVFDGAPAEELPGDGYSDYLKPFRTIEDIHVYLAAIAYILKLARSLPGTTARLAAVAASLAALADEPPLAPSTHVALEGALQLGRQAIEALDLGAAPPGCDDERARFERDRPLLRVAEKVRGLRFASACEALGIRMAE